MNGRCLCGAVTWSTDADLRDVLECHCVRCQRVTGNYMAATAVPTGELSIAGESPRWYSPTDDSNVTYGFCATCGSSMFYRSGGTDGSNSVTSICAGSIDGPSGLRTAAVWFAADAGDHVRLDPGVPTFPGEP